MLFLTPQQSFHLRSKILTDLQNDSYVEMDLRFVKPLFGGTADLRRWCETWNIKHEFFTRPGMFRLDRKTLIEWVSFSYPEPEGIVIL